MSNVKKVVYDRVKACLKVAQDEYHEETKDLNEWKKHLILT